MAKIIKSNLKEEIEKLRADHNKLTAEIVAESERLSEALNLILRNVSVSKANN